MISEEFLRSYEKTNPSLRDLSPLKLKYSPKNRKKIVERHLLWKISPKNRFLDNFFPGLTFMLKIYDLLKLIYPLGTLTKLFQRTKTTNYFKISTKNPKISKKNSLNPSIYNQNPPSNRSSTSFPSKVQEFRKSSQ